MMGRIGQMWVWALLASLFLATESVAGAVSTCPIAREMAHKAVDIFDRLPDRGLEALKRARELCPNDLAISYNLGLATYTSGDKREARRIWEELYNNHPEHLNTLANLAWVTFELGDDETAHILAFKGFSNHPGNMSLAHTKLYSLFRMGRYLEAYDWLTRAGLSGARADKWRKMAVEYVVETLWRKFRGGATMDALRKSVDLLVAEYAEEADFITAKDQLILAAIDPEADIPHQKLLPHEVWPQSGNIDDRSEVLDDYLETLPHLSGWKKRQDAFAVIVGINRYKTIRGRHFADRDAQNLHRLLGRRGLFIDDPEHMRLRVDEGATLDVLQADIRWLLKQGRIDPNAMLLFYFSGRGMPWATGGMHHVEDILLAPVGVKLEEMDPDHAISLAWLREELDKLPNPEIMVVVDGCFNANPACNLKNHTDGLVPDRAFFKSQKPWVMAAITGEAKTHGPSRQGAFTHFLLKGMLGPADGADGSPKDGWVDLNEGFAYLRSQTQKSESALDPLFSHPTKIRLTRVGGER
ncbi:MAG: caspase family protein [Magnetococcales bacterium]|nr:caspase family protein [Magnetococcales bacterium]